MYIYNLNPQHPNQTSPCPNYYVATPYSPLPTPYTLLPSPHTPTQHHGAPGDVSGAGTK